MTELIFVLIIISALCWFIFNNNYETFDDLNQNLLAHDPYDFPEYRQVNYGGENKILRKKRLLGLMEHTRQSGITKQRHMYNDMSICKTLPMLHDKAHLRELRLPLKNRYHATINKCQLNYLNKDDVNQNKCYYNINLDKHHSSNRTMNLAFTSKWPLRTSGLPYLDDTIFDIANRTNKIMGYDKLHYLPQNYADRSKRSTEHQITAPDINEAYIDHKGWLAWET